MEKGEGESGYEARHCLRGLYIYWKFEAGASTLKYRMFLLQVLQVASSTCWILCHSKYSHSFCHQHPSLHPHFLPSGQLTLSPSPVPLLFTDLDPGGLCDLPSLYLLRQINYTLSDQCGLWRGTGYLWNAGHLLPLSGFQLMNKNKSRYPNIIRCFSHYLPIFMYAYPAVYISSQVLSSAASISCILTTHSDSLFTQLCNHNNIFVSLINHHNSHCL